MAVLVCCGPLGTTNGVTTLAVRVIAEGVTVTEELKVGEETEAVLVIAAGVTATAEKTVTDPTDAARVRAL